MAINALNQSNVVVQPTATTAKTATAPAAPASAPAAAAPPPPPPPPQNAQSLNTSGDTVELTGASLAKSLKQSGQTPQQISQKMNVDLQTVDTYLGISQNPTPTVKPVVPAEETQALSTQNTAGGNPSTVSINKLI